VDFHALGLGQRAPGRARIVDATVVEQQESALERQRLFAPFAVGERDMGGAVDRRGAQRAAEQDRPGRRSASSIACRCNAAAATTSNRLPPSNMRVAIAGSTRSTGSRVSR
jgi:hypothetical protein